MDKIAKLLKKLSAKEREQIEVSLVALLSGKTENLDIKKLKGTDDIFRVRAGPLRIIFKKERDDIRILDIARRDENTYRSW